MMSTSEDEALAMECLEAGAHDFIAKLDINSFRLRRAILVARARHKMELKLKPNYVGANFTHMIDVLEGYWKIAYLPD